MVARIDAVVMLNRGDELNRDSGSALMQQLENRMLGVSPQPAPGYPGRRAAEWFSLRRHRLAVRFHFQLLEIVGKKPQALVIGEQRPALPTTHTTGEHVAPRRDPTT